MTTRRALVSFFGGIVVASIGTAASAGVLAVHPQSLDYRVIGVFLGLWVVGSLFALGCHSPRAAWKLLCYLAAVLLALAPAAWMVFVHIERDRDPQSLFALSGDSFLTVVTLICLPLAAALYAAGRLGSRSPRA